MNKKRLHKIIFFLASFIYIGTTKINATTEALKDSIPPVFDSSIKTEYIVKKSEDGSKFIPENVIKGITAVDDVDGQDVTIELVQNSVDLSSNGEYYVVYVATDKSGNSSFLVVTVMVDGIAPEFDENTENLYYMNQLGMVFDSNYNVVEELPGTLMAKDSPGAYEGIGVVMTTDEFGNIVFVSTIDNSPAVGVLQANDILIGINGENICGKTTDYVSHKIKGTEGTQVELQIIRNNQEISVTLERQMVKLHEDEEIEAEASIKVDSIDPKLDGTIEIIYTVTDEAGNSAQFTINVEVDTTSPMINVDDKKENDDEKAYIANTTDETSDDKEGKAQDNVEPEEIEGEKEVVDGENVDSEENGEETAAEVADDKESEDQDNVESEKETEGKEEVAEGENIDSEENREETMLKQEKVD